MSQCLDLQKRIEKHLFFAFIFYIIINAKNLQVQPFLRIYSLFYMDFLKIKIFIFVEMYSFQ